MNGGVSIGDALLYLDQIKAKTSISVYTEFLGIMEQFRSQSISTPCAIERVKTLFKGIPPSYFSSLIVILPH